MQLMEFFFLTLLFFALFIAGTIPILCGAYTVIGYYGNNNKISIVKVVKYIIKKSKKCLVKNN